MSKEPWNIIGIGRLCGQVSPVCNYNRWS